MPYARCMTAPYSNGAVYTPSRVALNESSGERMRVPCAGADALKSHVGESVSVSVDSDEPHSSKSVQGPSTCSQRSASAAAPVAAKDGNAERGGRVGPEKNEPETLVAGAPSGHAVRKAKKPLAA